MATRGRTNSNRLLLLRLCLLFLNSQVWAFIGRPTPIIRNIPTLANDSTRYIHPGFFKSPRTSSSLTPLSMWKWNDELQGRDRIKACIPYILPLLDGDQFGQYIYERISVLGCVNAWTLGPLVDLFHKVPFLSITLFCALTLGTRFNFEGMDRNVRFNAQQAALLDVVLLLPEFIGSAFMNDPLPRWIVEPCNNLVYYVCISTVSYCIYSNLRGKKPDQLPFISSGAELMTGPF